MGYEGTKGGDVMGEKYLDDVQAKEAILRSVDGCTQGGMWQQMTGTSALRLRSWDLDNPNYCIQGVHDRGNAY